MHKQNIVKERIITDHDAGTYISALPNGQTAVNIYRWLQKFNVPKVVSKPYGILHCTLLSTAKTIAHPELSFYAPDIIVPAAECELQIVTIRNCKSLVISLHNKQLINKKSRLHTKHGLTGDSIPHITVSYNIPNSFRLPNDRIDFPIVFFKETVGSFQHKLERNAEFHNGWKQAMAPAGDDSRRRTSSFFRKCRVIG